MVTLALATCACGASAPRRSTNPYAGLPPDVRPRPVGPGPPYRPRALSAAVRRRAPIDGLRCATPRGRPFGIHLELFAHRLVIHIPAGIGIAPPQRGRGVYVLAGACTYPVRSLEPTGVFQITRGRNLTLGNLFTVWGQPLTARQLLSFHGPVLAFLNGHPWHRPLPDIPLRRHAEIVLEVDGTLPPHPSYTFAPGL
ncbi:MAG TPA: hypothetical protein VIJ20_12355 [Solirubrobacteraceae bacterium]